MSEKKCKHLWRFLFGNPNRRIDWCEKCGTLRESGEIGSGSYPEMRQRKYTKPSDVKWID